MSNPSKGRLAGEVAREIRKLRAGVVRDSAVYGDHGGLDLTGWRIRVIPPEIGRADTSTLLLARNEIAALPAELFSMTQLQHLDLSDNYITELPREIGALTNLGTLDLRRNRLINLPNELGFLHSHLNLRLEGNPLAEPLPELAHRGTKDLLVYLRSLASGPAAEQYEAKLLLIGEGNVGKTSLIAALRGEPFVAERPTTHGIEIGNLTVRHPGQSVDITLNSWDFGGQDVYRATHQFFFSRRCLYLLVWRPREGHEGNSVEDWCRRIRLRVGEDARVIIVATHAHERRPELDFPYLQREFPNLVVGHCSVDNSDGTGVDRLRDLVAQEAANLPQMGEIISERWIKTRDQLKHMPQSQISYEEYKAVCSLNDVDNIQAQTLAGMLHDLGQIVYYGEDTGLRDIVVLRPEWLTKAIGYVIDDRKTEKSDGVLDHARLRTIWGASELGQSYALEHHPYFLRLMEKFDISYRIVGEDQSLVAQLVPFREPKLPWHVDSPVPDGLLQLSLKVLMTDVAPGLMAWLTVRNQRFSCSLHWRRGVFLAHSDYDAEALLFLSAAKELTLTVRAPAPEYFFTILRDGLQHLIRQRWPGLKYEIVVPCPRSSNGTRCVGEFDLLTLEAYRTRQILTDRCRRCFAEQDVSELLTGFAPQIASIEDVVVREVRISGEMLRQEIRAQGETDSAERRGEIAAYTATIANDVRALLRLTSTEMPDCPRLFTLVPAPIGWVKRQINKMRGYRSYRIVLWCEHPGNEHPWPDAQYDFRRPQEWLETVGPYLAAVTKLLKAMLPVAGAIIDAARSSSWSAQTSKDLQVMESVVAALPDEAVGDKVAELAKGGRHRAGHRAAGAELRAVRALLIDLDPAMRFGDLRRVVAPAGEYLWVCPGGDHYRAYDPGLPVLPT